ncbi:uncharacterized protein ARMOST_18348 [Armillaria ostoyae]|uniref:Uncharacterized protein n=1 Tax=Armillaria ostoyae TaxID=47428 RepID=A0A284S1J2_ARMOS|nr:uncharacterized protein ARMOST_18348 [Armillaria ostoyae]
MLEMTSTSADSIYDPLMFVLKPYQSRFTLLRTLFARATDPYEPVLDRRWAKWQRCFSRARLTGNTRFTRSLC